MRLCIYKHLCLCLMETQNDNSNIRRCLLFNMNHDQINNKGELLVPIKKIITHTDKWGQVRHDLGNQRQLEILSQIASAYNSADDDVGIQGKIEEIDNKDDDVYKKLILDNIRKKISSYKQQDLIKNKYNKVLFVDIQEVLFLLNQCQLKCHYCNKQVQLLYENVRDGLQWSLDRINNAIGHNKENLYISCLTCNLRRRCLYPERFLFTKRLKLVKLE